MTDSIPHTLPKYWTNLLLVRHGESTCNEANRFAGSADAPLTHLGREQARQAHRSLDGPTPDRLFVSNLSRARETAEIMFPSVETGLVHEIDDRIRERNFGEFTLRNKAELQARHGILGFDKALYDQDGAIHGAEPYQEFENRVNQFLLETVVPLLKKGVRVLVVAHKYVVELLVRIILGAPDKNGYDLRLPNSKILNGGDIRHYVQKESRIANRFREWCVLHHGSVLAIAGLMGLGISAACGPFMIPWQLGFGVLMAATLISMLRVDLVKATRSTFFEWKQSVLRFALIPLLMALVVYVSGAQRSWIVVSLIFSAPAALTSVTMSRCAGGMVHAAVGTMLRSMMIGTITLIAIAENFFAQSSIVPLSLVSLAVVGFPCISAAWLRKANPVAAADFGERQAVWPVVLLGVFVLISCMQLNSNELFTTGIQALGLGFLLRLVSAAVTRWSDCVSPDDYLSHGFPNLFLLVVLGQVSGLTELTHFATWLLVPMFLLAPLDIRICRRFASTSTNESTLRQYLKLESSEREIDSLTHTPTRYPSSESTFFCSEGRMVDLAKKSDSFGMKS